MRVSRGVVFTLALVVPLLLGTLLPPFVKEVEASSITESRVFSGNEEADTTLTGTFYMPPGMKYVASVKSSDNAEVEYTVNEANRTVHVTVKNVKGRKSVTRYTGEKTGYVHMGGKSALVEGPLDSPVITYDPAAVYAEYSMYQYRDIIYGEVHSVSEGWSRAEYKEEWVGAPKYWRINGYNYERCYSADFRVRWYTGIETVSIPTTTVTIKYSDTMYYWTKHPIQNIKAESDVLVEPGTLIHYTSTSSSPLLKAYSSYRWDGTKYVGVGPVVELGRTGEKGYEMAGDRLYEFEYLGQRTPGSQPNMFYYKKKVYIRKTQNTKGSVSEVVSSADRDAYPDQGEKGSYWYTFYGDKKPTQKTKWVRYEVEVDKVSESGFKVIPTSEWIGLERADYGYTGARATKSGYDLHSPRNYIPQDNLGLYAYGGSDPYTVYRYRFDNTSARYVTEKTTLNRTYNKIRVVNSILEDYEGAYPDGGIGFDGYWYEKSVPPELSLDSKQKIYVSANPGRSVFKITGSVENIMTGPVEVKASVANVSKTVRVDTPVSGGPTRFELSWDVIGDNIPEGTYSNIKVTASNGTGVTEKVSNLVAVVDKTKPIATSVLITSNNYNQKYAKQGDQVSVIFTSSEELATNINTKINNIQASKASSSGNRYVYTRVLGQSDPDGRVSFRIEFEDLAGNKNIATKITSGDDVIYYGVPPVLNPVNIYSNNKNPEFAKVNEQAILEFSLNHDLKEDPLVRIAGRLVNVERLGNGNYRARTTMTESDNEGHVPFVIDNVIDAAGNNGRSTQDNTTGRRLAFDKTAPYFTTVSISEDEGKAVLRLISREKLSVEPKVEISGNSVKVQQLADLIYEATYTLTGLEQEGDLPFKVFGHEDLAGNKGSDVTSTTDGSRVVIGNKSPKIEYVKVYSNNTDPSLASEGDTVFVEFKSSDKLGELLEVNIQGQAAELEELTNNIWKASKVMSSGDKEGVVSFRISSIYNLSGIKSKDIETTTDGSRVIFSKGSPSVTKFTVKSSNPNPSYAKLGDTITIFVEVSKDLYDSPVVTVAGNRAVISNSSGRQYVYTYEVLEGDPEGVLDITVGSVVDNGGNSGEFLERTTDGSKIIFDKTSPSLKDVRIIGGERVGEKITITFESSEELSTTPSASVKGSTSAVEYLGNNKYKIEKILPSDSQGLLEFYISDIYDLAGNQGTAVTNLDNGNNSVIESSGVLMITLYGVEDGKSYSGVATPTFSASSALSQEVEVSATLDGKTWNSGKPVKSIGQHILEIKAEDSLGNKESLKVSFRISE